MKVTIEDRPKEEEEVKWEYPCLGKHDHWGGIVLFYCEGEGTIIKEGDVSGCRFLGDFNKHHNMKEYTPLKNKRIIIDC